MANMNPYEPPVINVASVAEMQSDNTKASTATLIAWPLVLASNLVIPLLLGSSLLRENGKLGLLASVLVVGAAILILTQLLPIIQIIAGSIAFGIAKSLGQARIGDDEGLDDSITSEWGGFIVASVTGSILACLAFVVGTGVLAAMNGFRNRSPITYPQNPLN